MGVTALVILASISMTIGIAAQNSFTRPKLSKDPLTDEAIAVYRAVLRSQLKDSGGNINLSNKTKPLELDRPFLDKACIQEIAPGTTDDAVPVIHRLTRALAISSKVVLVDGQQQEHKIKKMTRMTTQVTTKELDKSIKLAFSTGLFTLSEIIFDNSHQRAVVSYEFFCGMLCGHGGTVVVEKIGDKWKVNKTCGGWIS